MHVISNTYWTLPTRLESRLLQSHTTRALVRVGRTRHGLFQSHLVLVEAASHFLALHHPVTHSSEHKETE